MDKRYQVFVSSTYADLKEERRAVIQTLMEMDCIPAGMELFPATDEAQWEFIKKVINDCDYYVLVIGGRYGSTTQEGASYTEQEYDYAVSRAIKVLAFVHDAPDAIRGEKAEVDPALKERLGAFRNKVMEGRLVKPWKNAAELPGLVALSLGKTMKTYPAVGWVRGDQVASAELLSELNGLRKQNDELQKSLVALRAEAVPRVANLAAVDEEVTINGKYWSGNYNPTWSVGLKWAALFALIAPHLLGNPSDASVKAIATKELFELSGKSGTTSTLDDVDFQTMKIQFMALGLVNVQYTPAVGGGMGLFWSLTPAGRAALIELRTVRSKTPK